MVDTGFITQLEPLLNPNLWWFWEMIGLIFYYFAKFGKQFGKDLHFIMRSVDTGWKWIDTRYVEPGKKTFQRKKGQSFNVTGKPSFRKGGIMGGEVWFHDIEKARPRLTQFKEGNGTDIKLDVGKRPNGAGLDPTSAEFDDFAERQSMFQVLKSNASTHPEFIMLVIVGAAAFFAGVIFGPYLATTSHNVVCNQVNGTVVCH